MYSLRVFISKFFLKFRKTTHALPKKSFFWGWVVLDFREYKNSSFILLQDHDTLNKPDHIDYT